MVENEAMKNLETLERFYRIAKSGSALHEVLINFVTLEDLVVAIQALEEIQQYRAIGLTPELIEAMQGHNVALINDLGEYQAIGTIEELKALKEKNEPKKPIIHGLGQRYCPICKCGGADHFYCARCGQKLG